jgi:hypothetical protein
MTPALAEADRAEQVYRLGRAPDPWDWPDWTYAQPDGTFGNRYDDPQGEYRVLYASTERVAVFMECLARFRPDPAVDLAAIVTEDEDAPYPTRPAGSVPVSWLGERRMGVAALDGRFCAVGHADSLVHLRSALAGRLVHYRLEDLDAGDIRTRAPRRFTQEISRYVFEQATASGEQAFSGIQYGSRLGDDLTNWALFEGHDPMILIDGDPVAPDDPDLVVVLERYDLRLI